MRTCHPLELCNEPPAFIRSCDGSILLGHNTLMEFNLRGHPFPGWSEAKDRLLVSKQILAGLDKLFSPDEWILQAEMQQLTREERTLLLEREQITPTMAARKDGVYVLINRSQDTLAFINDEEHLMIQTYHPGGLEELRDARRAALTNQRRFLKGLPVAFDGRIGLLFSDPYKSGEGIWVAALVYLPGLMLSYQNHNLVDSMSDMGILCLPALSHTKKEKGDLYWLCSPTTQYLREDADYETFLPAIEELCEREEEARRDIMSADSAYRSLLNELEAALVTLEKSKSLSYRSLLHALSMLRLGLTLGELETDVPEERVCQIIARAYTQTMPSYLQLAHNAQTLKKRRSLRAELVRKLISEELRIRIPSTEN